jgi:hypothetical protein
MIIDRISIRKHELNINIKYMTYYFYNKLKVLKNPIKKNYLYFSVLL